MFSQDAGLEQGAGSASSASKPNRGAGRPKEDLQCLAEGCEKEKAKGCKCCLVHKPDYQNLYNDATAHDSIDEFHEIMKGPRRS